MFRNKKIEKEKTNYVENGEKITIKCQNMVKKSKVVTNELCKKIKVNMEKFLKDEKPLKLLKSNQNLKCNV